jgi:hypothetical protein
VNLIARRLEVLRRPLADAKHPQDARYEEVRLLEAEDTVSCWRAPKPRFA